MKEIINTINQIAATSGRNDKELILKQNKNNELLKEIFQFVYNPYVVTGLSTKKINKKVKSLNTEYISGIRGLMEYLSNNNTGTDKDIKSIQEFINGQSVELQELYKQIATKSLKIGVTAKTLNKIYGKDFIPEFNVMLAEKYFDYENKITDEFIITTKLDGGRTVIIKENGSIKFFTRQGQPIEDMIEIHTEAKLLPDNMVYDGELLLRNDKGLESKDLYRATMKETRKDGIKKNLIFNCFDILPLVDFKNGICKTSCIERKKQLHEILSELNLKTIVEVPILYVGSDKNKIIELLDQARSNNEEGVMLNIAKSHYQAKRTKDLLKVKVMQTADVRVVGMSEGTGKYKNKLGALLVEFKHNGELHKTEIGTGLSDLDREQFFNNPEMIIGKIIECSYFEISQNQNGGYGFRFGVFKQIRYDKDKISMY